MPNSTELPLLVAFTSALISLISLIVALHINFGRIVRRRYSLKNPIKAHFLIPANYHHGCEFAVQDDNEHLLTEITVPSDREVIIDLRLECRVPFFYSELIIRAIGDLDRKPYATKYFNRFIEVGAGQTIEPGEKSSHYIDRHKYYHVKGDRVCSAGTFISVAFSFKTRAPGLYPIQMFFPGDEVEGCLWNLFINIEELPHTVMICASRDHKAKPCQIRGITPIE